MKAKNFPFNDIDTTSAVAIDRRSALGQYEVVNGLPRLVRVHRDIVIFQA